jgi:hypothetical protein
MGPVRYSDCMSKQQNRKRRSPDSIAIGEMFGHVAVIGEPVKGREGNYFPCMCDCGTPTFVRMGKLTSSPNVSCGCAKFRKKHGGARRRSNSFKHGTSQERLYRIWCGIRYRCYNVDGPAFEHYGGRGIGMCDDWFEDYASFRAWSHDNGYQDTLTIDRIDVNGNYEPNNCRWVSRAKQSNNRRNTLSITLFGETKSLKEWVCDTRCQVKYQTAYQRLLAGWDAKAAITTPARQPKSTQRSKVA